LSNTVYAPVCSKPWFGHQGSVWKPCDGGRFSEEPGTRNRAVGARRALMLNTAGVAACLFEVASQFRKAGGARLDPGQCFCLLEVLAQSFAKLQPSSKGSRLNCCQTQAQRL